MTRYTNFHIFFTCITLTVVVCQNGKEYKAFPVYTKTDRKVHISDEESGMINLSTINNQSSGLHSKEYPASVGQGMSGGINPDSSVYINITRGPSKYQASAPIKQNHLQQLTDPIDGANFNPVGNTPLNSEQGSNLPNLLLPNALGQNSLAKPEVAAELTEPFTVKQFTPQRQASFRKLEDLSSDQLLQQPSQNLNYQNPPTNSLLKPEQWSSYTFYNPQISKSVSPESNQKLDGQGRSQSILQTKVQQPLNNNILPNLAPFSPKTIKSIPQDSYQNSYSPTYLGQSQQQPVPPSHYQTPVDNFYSQNNPNYNPESELTKKQDHEDSADEYLQRTASFINGGVATIFGLALSLMVLAIITASTVGRKKREVETLEDGFSWQVTDMIQCVTKFYCEMEQWDQKYPAPIKESKPKGYKERPPREAPARRKNCVKDYKKCPVNFTLMRTLWRMVQ